VDTETEVAEIEIDAAADAVWAVAGDFGGIGWMPGIESVTVDGDIRNISMGGMDIAEKLVGRDDEKQQITYSIVGGPVPLDFHEATISVMAAGDGARVSWSVTAAPTGSAAFLAGIYGGALQALKAKVEAGD